MGYDIGCLYPAEMPPPFVVRKSLGFRMAEYFMKQKDETPVVIHNAHVQAQLQANCVAFHNAKVLNSITLERPIFDIPSEYHNTYAISMCMAQAYYNYFGEEVAGDNLMIWNFPIYDRVPETCNGDATCLENLAIDLDYDPRFIAQIVIDEIYAKQEVDGWNALGNKKYSQASEGEVECTANCAPYMDTYGYFPLNHPGEENYEDKYSVTGDNAHWQPIQEANEWGSYTRQEHITPHIGFKAQTEVWDLKEADPPEYDFLTESELVIQRLADTATNSTKKEMIRFFDNKLYVRDLIQESFREQYPDIAFELYNLYFLALSTAEIDAVVNCWREKVRHDIVRPTTVIQRWGEDVIETYGGDPDADEAKFISAKDFHAFIRVMPHAEFPSGSASLCTSYFETSEEFTQHFYGESLNVLRVGGDGVQRLCETVEPSVYSWGCEEGFHTPTMQDLADACAESRLWGGMHFSESISAGSGIMMGIGKEVQDFILQINNGAEWTDGIPERPTCASL